MKNAILVFFIALISVSCKPQHTGLTLEMLRNAQYQTDTYTPSETIQLKNGIYFRTPPFPEQSSDWFTQLAGPIDFGDLNFDNIEDAIVILKSRSGGTGVTVELAAVINDNGKPRNVSTIILGDRVQVESMNITSGIVTLNMLIQGPNDGLCCPTLPVIWSWKLINNDLVRLP